MAVMPAPARQVTAVLDRLLGRLLGELPVDLPLAAHWSTRLQDGETIVRRDRFTAYRVARAHDQVTIRTETPLAEVFGIHPHYQFSGRIIGSPEAERLIGRIAMRPTYRPFFALFWFGLYLLGALAAVSVPVREGMLSLLRDDGMQLYWLFMFGFVLACAAGFGVMLVRLPSRTGRRNLLAFVRVVTSGEAGQR
jgi:hypothetical protein